MQANFEPLEKAQGAGARERVAAALKTLTSDAEELLKATAGDVSEKAKEARARLGAVLERAKSTCVHLQQRTAAAAKRADTAIRQHPYESIGVAFGLGLLIGVLGTRKRGTT